MAVVWANARVWSEYKNKGLVLIGVPSNNFRQEPGNNKEIKKFCETKLRTNYRVDVDPGWKSEIISGGID